MHISSRGKLLLVASAFAAAGIAGFFVFSPATQAGAVKSAIGFVAPDPIRMFGKSNLRVLVVGLDYDYDDKDQETSVHSRSDIIMALNLDLAHDRVSELSIPRDMVATLPNGAQAKINEAQSEGGIAESQAVVANWLGIEGFDRYVVLRIDTMKDLIDAIGGVDVAIETSDCLRYKTGCTDGHIDYDDAWGHLHVHEVEGTHHLDGTRAVGYARFRHDWCSDPCRIMRQQQVVKAIVSRLQGAGFAGNLTRIPPIVAVVNKDVQTNFTAREELSLAYALRSVSPGRIETAQVPYTAETTLPGYGSSIVADDAAKARLVAHMFKP